MKLSTTQRRSIAFIVTAVLISLGLTLEAQRGFGNQRRGGEIKATGHTGQKTVGLGLKPDIVGGLNASHHCGGLCGRMSNQRTEHLPQARAPGRITRPVKG